MLTSMISLNVSSLELVQIQYCFGKLNQVKLLTQSDRGYRRWRDQ